MIELKVIIYDGIMKYFDGGNWYILAEPMRKSWALHYLSADQKEYKFINRFSTIEKAYEASQEL